MSNGAGYGVRLRAGWRGLLLAAALLGPAACAGGKDACGDDGCPRLPPCAHFVDFACDADHLCREEVCEGVAWTCGPDATGRYSWHDIALPCDDHDPCTTDERCVNGACRGIRLDCTRANATGICSALDGAATCVFECAAGHGNCDDDWDNGCETPLGTTADCGSCGDACASVPNTSSVRCEGGRCVPVCIAPYRDCDGDYANGCELPHGLADQCHRAGLGTSSGTRTACGTPYCAAHVTDDLHQSFGHWHCQFCSHCGQVDGTDRWCLFRPEHEAGGGKGLYDPTPCTGTCSCGTGDWLQTTCCAEPDNENCSGTSCQTICTDPS